jgi:ParB-like chromosome segregation protein Spo0J
MLTTKEASDYLKLSIRSLERMRLEGSGPRYLKLRSSVRYRLSDLEAFVASRLVSSTSEAEVRRRLTPIDAPSVKKLEPHPFSAIMPSATEEEMNSLATDIGKNGVLHPIVMYQKKILDGNHRYRVLAEIYNFGKSASWVEFEGTDTEAKLFVISSNIHRRHLSPDARKAIIETLLKADPGLSNRAIASSAKVDDKTVGSVRQRLEATAEIPQLDATTGADGKTRKRKEKAKKTAVEVSDKVKIEYKNRLTPRPSSKPVIHLSNIC